MIVSGTHLLGFYRLPIYLKTREEKTNGKSINEMTYKESIHRLEHTFTVPYHFVCYDSLIY